MNNENLIPFNQMSEERRKEIARLGGIASGKRRKRNAEIKKAAKEVFHTTMLMQQYTEEEYQDFQKWQRSRKRKSYR